MNAETLFMIMICCGLLPIIISMNERNKKNKK
ncbi:hypothetical protein ACUXOR_000038 [Staphylococcus pasteuri]